jgi:GTP-binding protein HflX
MNVVADHQELVGIVKPYIKRQRDKAHWPDDQQVEDDLAEAQALAVALKLHPAFTMRINLSQPRPATLMGSGQIEQFKEMLHQHGAPLLYVDHPLTPIQQRNLEKALDAKVIDRHGLILEIFADRAATHEGRLQVELAQQTYLRSRLVRSWTHLERQRGGVGFMAGPGESQLEIDRRLIANRIKKIKADLAKVVAGRTLQRRGRQQSSMPLIALVGYTNSGKSTLFNRLTKSQAFAHDMVFATLDPTIRRVHLPATAEQKDNNGSVSGNGSGGDDGATILLSDTVGFIRDIPTQLIAAFQATLEEVVHADLLLHVYDVSSAEAPRRVETVNQTLANLFGQRDLPMPPVWMIANKLDRVEPGAELFAPPGQHPMLLSALTGQGCDKLLEELLRWLKSHRLVHEKLL